jgi:hypothetical protein
MTFVKSLNRVADNGVVDFDQSRCALRGRRRVVVVVVLAWTHAFVPAGRGEIQRPIT